MQKAQGGTQKALKDAIRMESEMAKLKAQHFAGAQVLVREELRHRTEND